jgi:dTDP-4-dehydrorhamnose reductase
VKIIVTGAGGMLAHDLVPELTRRGHAVLALRRHELDVTDAAAVTACLSAEAPAAVVQCAAYTAVDAAESDPDAAFRTNAIGAANVARACQRFDGLFVYPSTDYVFAGDADRPYAPQAPTAPINTYGRSKLAGEQETRRAPRWLIVRTSWLYGAGGKNFVDTIARLARERNRLEVVDDQTGRPTWAPALARTIAELLEAQTTGILHATDGGPSVSWFGFAKEIVALVGSPAEVVPVSSEQFASAAPRPRYSVLDCDRTERLLGHPLSDWKRNVAFHLADERSVADETSKA